MFGRVQQVGAASHAWNRSRVAEIGLPSAKLIYVRDIVKMHAVSAIVSNGDQAFAPQLPLQRRTPELSLCDINVRGHLPRADRW